MTKAHRSTPKLTPILRRPDPVATVSYELGRAYADCHAQPHPGGVAPAPSLTWCAPLALSVAEARRLARRFIGSYNKFSPARLNQLPADARVRLARDYSVCLYVEVTRPLDEAATRRDLRCDECHLEQEHAGVFTYRLWWD